MVKADDNRYKYSDLVALQWWREASVMPQMNKGGKFIFGYLIFEMIPINYRPILIDGMF